MIKRASKSRPPVHWSLRSLALCLDCAECFELGYSTCPACSSERWTALGQMVDVSPRQAARQALIVSRSRKKLFEYLKRAFTGNDTVEVMLDRRLTERRRSLGGRLPDRRRSDRRANFTAEAQLRAMGWAVVRMDAPRRSNGSA